MRKRWLGIMLGAGLAGCAVGPDYQKPALPTPGRYIHAATQPAAAQAVDLAQWWAGFGDATLTELVEQALRHSPDLRVAEARLRQARAQYGVTTADRYPTFNVDGGVTHQRRSENAGGVPGPVETNAYQAGFDASWEIDLFGAVGRNVEAAGREVEAATAARDAAQVSLSSEVARTYIDLRSYQQRRAIAQRNLAAQTEAVDLAQARYRAGLVSDLDVAQAQALAATTAAQLPELDRLAEQTRHALEVLLGEMPGTLAEKLRAGEEGMTRLRMDAALPVGLPSDLLERRPDVRRAERALAAATARVGAATADLYPRFMLTGTAGLQSVAAEDFFAGNSRYYTLGPSVRWPILDFGRVRARIDLQEAGVQQTLAEYEKTWLTALGEVESALVAQYREQQRLESLQAALEAQQRAHRQARELYRQGLIGYLNVIDAQRQMLTAEDALAQSRRALLQDGVALAKALGGGWRPTAAAKVGR